MKMCGSKIAIRRCRERDIDPVYLVEKSSFPDPFPKWYIKLLYGLSGRYCYVAAIGTKITGYAAFIPLSNKSCHLASIAVAPPYRRRNIASCLLLFGEYNCRLNRYEGIYLEVEYTNVPAILLYRKHGYSFKGMIIDYYGEGRHAIIMSKKLNSS